MKITYDKSVDALYIYFIPALETKWGIVTRSEGDYPIHLDFTKDGQLFGIEILDASKIINNIDCVKHLTFQEIRG